MKDWKAGLLAQPVAHRRPAHGFSVFGIGSYCAARRRLQALADRSQRGSASQWLGASGLGLYLVVLQTHRLRLL